MSRVVIFSEPQGSIWPRSYAPRPGIEHGITYSFIYANVPEALRGTAVAASTLQAGGRQSTHAYSNMDSASSSWPKAPAPWHSNTAG